MKIVKFLIFLIVLTSLSLLFYSKYVKEKCRVEEGSYLKGQLSILQITGGCMIIQRGTYCIKLEKN